MRHADTIMSLEATAGLLTRAAQALRELNGDPYPVDPSHAFETSGVREISAEMLTPKRRAKGKKRHFSAAAREKMRLAQKKRWAKWHREQGAK